MRRSRSAGSTRSRPATSSLSTGRGRLLARRSTSRRSRCSSSSASCSRSAHGVRARAARRRGRRRKRPASSRCASAAAGSTGCDARAGQFFLWRFLDARPLVGVAPVLALGRSRRPARCGSPSRASATTRARWREIRPGTRVVAEGPFGVFTDAVRRRDKVAADRRRDRDHARPRAARRDATATSPSSTA